MKSLHSALDSYKPGWEEAFHELEGDAASLMPLSSFSTARPVFGAM